MSKICGTWFSKRTLEFQFFFGTNAIFYFAAAREPQDWSPRSHHEVLHEKIAGPHFETNPGKIQLLVNVDSEVTVLLIIPFYPHPTAVLYVLYHHYPPKKIVVLPVLNRSSSSESVVISPVALNISWSGSSLWLCQNSYGKRWPSRNFVNFPMSMVIFHSDVNVYQAG